MRGLTAGFLASVLLLCGGCSLISIERVEHYQDSEGVFDVSLLGVITPRVTSRVWLLEQFGQPLYEQPGRDDATVMTWQFVRQKKNRAGVFGLVSYKQSKEEQRYLHVITQHGVVLRHWRDKFAAVDANKAFDAIGLSRPAAPIEESQPLPAVETPSAGASLAPERTDT